MASKKIPSGSEEFMMFKEFWRIYQEYYDPEDNEQYWESAMNDISRFYQDFAEFPIALELALALTSCFEKKSKQKK